MGQVRHLCLTLNLMPMAVYCLMFRDPELKKLTPSNMEIETYTTDVVKNHRYVLFLFSTPQQQKTNESHVLHRKKKLVAFYYLVELLWN